MSYSKLAFVAFTFYALAGSPARAVDIMQKQESLFLEDASCTAADQAAQGLQTWADPGTSQKICSPKPAQALPGRRSCTTEISSCVPDFVAAHLGKKAQASGPNCWNSALVASGILPSVRFSNVHEIAFYLPSPLCQKLGEFETKKAGDIGAIWLFEKGKLANDGHAFTYVANDLAFYKDGKDQNRPYMFGSIRESWRQFRKNMLQSCKVDGFQRSDCRVSLDYYRCQSLSSYLSAGVPLPEEVSHILYHYEQFEGYLQQRAMNGRARSPDIEAEFKTFLQEANKQLIALAPSASGEAKIAFLLSSLRWRLDSIRDQLMFLGDPLVNDIVDESNDFDRMLFLYLTGAPAHSAVNIEKLLPKNVE